MKSDIFYQLPTQTACELKFINSSDWQEHLTTRDTLKSAYAFSAKTGELWMDEESSDKSKLIWIGTGSGDRLTAIAIAATKLSAGAYAFAETLSDHELIMWALAQYRFDRYKTVEIPIRILEISSQRKQKIITWAETIFFVRDLINTPAQEMGPIALMKEAQSFEKLFDAKVRICDGDDLKDGYPAIHAVGRAAVSAPRLIDLTWGKQSDPLVILVGKGVSFDTGGLDIKISGTMRIMKKDMGGAAHALGLARWIIANNLPICLRVLIPAVENAIGPDAYRPGDILRMRNGLTVEIETTDAEGRLVLADALTRACEEQPDLLLDFSTLTGAARVALGADVPAMFTDDDIVAHDLYEASKEVNDPIWRLPLVTAYESMLDSTVADLMNASTTAYYAGAITAALFLRRFVSPSVPWVHFDLGGWNPSSKPGKPEGGEAMSIRTVAHFLQKRYG